VSTVQPPVPGRRAGRPAGLGGRWRAAARRLTADREQLQADEEAAAAARLGGTPCGELSGRRRATVSGTLHSVTLRPHGGVPALEAQLSDGTGSLVLVWLGRREIVGVEPGAALRVEGFVACTEGRKVLYNPRYELVPRARA
jgi:hypothetical protein